MADEKVVPIVITPSWSDFPVLAEMDFNTLCEEYRMTKQQIKSLEEDADRLKGDIEAAMIVAGHNKVVWNGINVCRRNGRSRSEIKPQLLAAQGVSTNVIKAATVPGTAYTYIVMDDPSTRTKKETAQEAAVDNGNA